MALMPRMTSSTWSSLSCLRCINHVHRKGSVALSHEDAVLLGLRLAQRDFTSRSSTANGVVATGPVRIKEIRVGDTVVRDVEATVLPPGVLRTGLLGITFLQRLEGFEV